MTSEVHWYHEDGSQHLCDSFGCLEPAVSYWEFWKRNEGTCWHLCPEHSHELELLVTDSINPVQHELYETEDLVWRLP
jgi:hypothetical protein